MKIHRFEQKQIVPISIETAWEFFSNPRNLERITPKELNFVIKSPLPDRVYPGLLIVYDVKPILNIPVEWVTEITQSKEPHFFIDEQRFGPYRFWHHQHFFKETSEGIEMTDIVHYKLPIDFFGLINKLVVLPKLEKIFSFRRNVLDIFFGIDR